MSEFHDGDLKTARNVGLSAVRELRQWF